MRRVRFVFRQVGTLVVLVGCLLVVAVSAGQMQMQKKQPSAGSSQPPAVTRQLVLRGREVVINHDCGGCHGGSNPAADGWLAGVRKPEQVFKIGPCAVKPDAKPCFNTYPRNLTPDNVTGLGQFSMRQIFNALRYGLRPGETADVVITSTTPGKGNFPQEPKYLAPPMPWPAWRHLPDSDLWAIAAYLKYGVKPVRNKVQDSEGPPDFWASEYTVEKIGPYPGVAFPAAQEEFRPPTGSTTR